MEFSYIKLNPHKHTKPKASEVKVYYEYLKEYWDRKDVEMLAVIKNYTAAKPKQVKINVIAAAKMLLEEKKQEIEQLEKKYNIVNDVISALIESEKIERERWYIILKTLMLFKC